MTDVMEIRGVNVSGDPTTYVVLAERSVDAMLRIGTPPGIILNCEQMRTLARQLYVTARRVEARNA